MSSPKIIILQLKDIIYTALFAILGIILLIVLINMFVPDKDNDMEPTMDYSPGIYSSSFLIDNKVLNVEVTIYDDQVQGVAFTELDPALSIMYPLLEPAMADVNTHMKKKGNLDEMKPDEEANVTTSFIIQAVDKALEKARVN